MRAAGEYFLSEVAKRDRVREERKVKQEEAMGAKAKQVRLAALLVCCRVFERPMVPAARPGVCGTE